MIVLTKLWNLIDGHKTQIAAIALLITGFCINRGYLAQDAADLILGLIGLLTGVWDLGAIIRACGPTR